MKIETFYISGPMSWYPGHNFAAFSAAEGQLLLKGYKVLNPAKRGVIDGWEWQDYLKSDLFMLLEADAVATLTGWQESRGACLEVYVAQALGIPVMPLGKIPALPLEPPA